MAKEMIQKNNKVKLLGAVQINNTSYFVCKNKEGKVCLETGKEEKLQKATLCTGSCERCFAKCGQKGRGAEVAYYLAGSVQPPPSADRSADQSLRQPAS